MSTPGITGKRKRSASLVSEAYGLIKAMQPQEPLPPPLPLGGGKRDSILSAPDGKKNPFQEHVVRPKEVPLAKPEYEPAETAQAVPQPGQPQVPAQTPAAEHPYSFILQSQKPAKQFSLPGRSLAQRIALSAGGLLLLVIVFSLIKGAFGGSPDLAPVVATVERQQELLHVMTSAVQQQSISPTNKNFALTAQLSLGSAQANLLKYLSANGTKVKDKQLTSKISSSVDTSLTTAVANSSYNQVFQTTMQAQLNGYIQGLKQAYNQDKGAKGRALLKDDYNQAQLLLLQLNTPAS